MADEQKPPCGACGHVYHDGLCGAMKHDVAGEYECGCVDYFPPKVEEDWIRDVSARSLNLKAGPEQLLALCEGERQFCALCGAGAFLLWPMREWAQHVLDAHAAEMTDQQAAFYSELVKTNMNQQSLGALQAHFYSRISLRRRARDLDLVIFQDSPRPGVPRIVQPGGGKLN
jgi:hypothetical protein